MVNPKRLDLSLQILTPLTTYLALFKIKHSWVCSRPIFSIILHPLSSNYNSINILSNSSCHWADLIKFWAWKSMLHKIVIVKIWSLIFLCLRFYFSDFVCLFIRFGENSFLKWNNTLDNVKEYSWTECKAVVEEYLGCQPK